MTKIYNEPTECHYYLDHSSSHREHTKCSIVYSQSLTARRISSFGSEFLKHCNKMKLNGFAKEN